MFTRLKVVHKISIMPILAISALFLMVFVSQLFMRRNNKLLTQVEAYFVPALELGRDMEYMLIEIQRDMQDAVALADKEELALVDPLYHKYLQLFEKARANPFFETAHLDQFQSAFQGYYAFAKNISLYLIEGGRLNEEMLANLALMQKQYNTIKTQLKAQTGLAKTRVSMSFATALKNSRNSAMLMNIIIVCCATLFGGLSLLLSRSMTEPLRELVNATNLIARGDLTQQIVIRSGDELATLGNAMNHMRVELLEFYQSLEQLVAERTHQLQESEARFRRVVASISDHIYMAELTKDGEWRALYHSPNVEALTGYYHEKFVEDSYFWPSLIHPNDKSAVDVQLARFFRGQDSEIEYRLTRKDGKTIWVRDSGRVEIQEEQQNAIVFGVVSDITQRKQAEAEQLRLEAELRQSQRLEALGKLAGGTAHEFNNILAIMMGNIEVGLDDLPEDCLARTRFEQAYKTGERGRNLVSKILSFSRSSKQNLKPILPAPIVRDAIKMIQRTLPPTIELREQIKPDCRAIMANSLQIEQIVINLSNNAVHAMDEQGGTLQITLEDIEYLSAPSEFPGLSPGQYVKLVISDTGHGMSSGVKHRMFDPFFTTKEVGKGSGLGLSIVHGLIRQHRGQVTVESEAGQGTIITIVFPVTQKTVQEISVKDLLSGAIEERKEPHERKRPHEHLLIVDNNPDSIKIVQLGLEKLGYKLTTSRTGMEALKSIRDHAEQFDLMLIAQVMPGKTGIELCRDILEIRPDLPIILYTGSSDVIRDETVQRAGIRRFLRKPLRLRLLNQTIREILDLPNGKGVE